MPDSCWWCSFSSRNSRSFRTLWCVFGWTTRLWCGASVTRDPLSQRSSLQFQRLSSFLPTSVAYTLQCSTLCSTSWVSSWTFGWMLYPKSPSPLWIGDFASVSSALWQLSTVIQQLTCLWLQSPIIFLCCQLVPSQKPGVWMCLQLMESCLPLSSSSYLITAVGLPAPAVILWESASYHTLVGGSTMVQTIDTLVSLPSSQHQILLGQGCFSVGDVLASLHLRFSWQP